MCRNGNKWLGEVVVRRAYEREDLANPGAVEVRKQEVREIETLRIHHGQREGTR
jgi:hypothetical protein